MAHETGLTRDRVLECFDPGVSLMVPEIARMLGLHRYSVLYALRQLAEEGLIVCVGLGQSVGPRKGKPPRLWRLAMRSEMGRAA